MARLTLFYHFRFPTRGLNPRVWDLPLLLGFRPLLGVTLLGLHLGQGIFCSLLGNFHPQPFFLNSFLVPNFITSPIFSPSFPGALPNLGVSTGVLIGDFTFGAPFFLGPFFNQTQGELWGLRAFNFFYFLGVKTKGKVS